MQVRSRLGICLHSCVVEGWNSLLRKEKQKGNEIDIFGRKISCDEPHFPLQCLKEFTTKLECNKPIIRPTQKNEINMLAVAAFISTDTDEQFRGNKEEVRHNKAVGYLCHR